MALRFRGRRLRCHVGCPGTIAAGKFRIARAGSTLSGYIGNTLIYSKTSTSALNAVAFMLQLQPGSNDLTAATFDNFHFTAACP